MLVELVIGAAVDPMEVVAVAYSDKSVTVMLRNGQNITSYVDQPDVVAVTIRNVINKAASE